MNQGANVTFNVVATGTAPLSYQWQFNGANISGATSASYTKNNVQASDAGNYSVVVTNVAGTVTSSNAVLTVNVPPSITTQPQGQTVNVGANVTFSVTATGLGADSFNVGSDGAAFGVANNTLLNVYSLLEALNEQAVNGVLYASSTTLQKEASDLFNALDKAGAIA